ncbi:MAG: diaminobutyrate acetyltransferase [Bacillota bacterium]|jgi:L-2,4-diaminobutyric acid acetyltransferase
MENDVTEKLRLRSPQEEDAKTIWELIKNTKVLDLNSAYSYLLLSKYFSETCVVAEIENKVIGFISAFSPPHKPEVLFVWQVAVDEAFRRRKLGLKMLKHLLNRGSCRKTQFLEITITPSNKAAESLYRKLAAELKTNCELFACFPAQLFPGGQHEDELMLRIGPIKK